MGAIHTRTNEGMALTSGQGVPTKKTNLSELGSALKAFRRENGLTVAEVVIRGEHSGRTTITGKDIADLESHGRIDEARSAEVTAAVQRIIRGAQCH